MLRNKNGKSECFALWNKMVSEYMNEGDTDIALKLFEEMPQKNVICWTTVIFALVQLNKADGAGVFFQRMTAEGVVLDEVMMLVAFSTSGQLGALSLGEWIRSHIYRCRVHETIALNNVLIDMYAKFGRELKETKNKLEELRMKIELGRSAMKFKEKEFEEDQELEPIAILDRRMVKRKNKADTMLLISWKNLSPTESTWEFFSDLRLRFPNSPLWTRNLEEEGNVMGVNRKERTSKEYG